MKKEKTIPRASNDAVFDLEIACETFKNNADTVLWAWEIIDSYLLKGEQENEIRTFATMMFELLALRADELEKQALRLRKTRAFVREAAA